jgi:hypothetical protein
MQGGLVVFILLLTQDSNDPLGCLHMKEESLDDTGSSATA